MIVWNVLFINTFKEISKRVRFVFSVTTTFSLEIHGCRQEWFIYFFLINVCVPLGIDKLQQQFIKIMNTFRSTGMCSVQCAVLGFRSFGREHDIAFCKLFQIEFSYLALRYLQNISLLQVDTFSISEVVDFSIAHIRLINFFYKSLTLITFLKNFLI